MRPQTTKNERIVKRDCFSSSQKQWDIHCDICGNIIMSGAFYHGNSDYAHSLAFSVRVSKYRAEYIQICNKHSDRSIEKFIDKLQKDKETKND